MACLQCIRPGRATQVFSGHVELAAVEIPHFPMNEAWEDVARCG